MGVRGSNSLYFSTEISNDKLKSGANEATGIIQNLAGTIASINPFAILATGAVTAFATIASSAYKMMREFEHAMKEVETISAATQANFKDISSQVFAISKMSPDAPVQLAKAYYQIVSAGYDGAKGLQLLETASKAATAGVTDTLTAADGITTVLNAFKLEAGEAATVSDALFQTVKLGKTNFAELSQSLAQVAPLAAASGYSFQEVLAAVATLTKSGTPTAQAMTQIRSGIEAVTEVLGDGAAEALTLQNAFKLVYEQAGGSQNKLKELTGRVEAMNAIIALTGENSKGAANDLKALGDSAGSAEEAFRRMAGSNVNEWKILRNRIKATTDEIGSSLVEISSGVAKFLNDSLKDSNELKKSYDSQREELFKLKGALSQVNEDSEEFKDLRKQIINQYPEFVSGIDSEKASTEQLLGVLNQVNEAYKLRYKFEKRQKELKDALQKEGDIEYSLDNAEVRFEETLAKLERIADDNKITLKYDPNSAQAEILAAVKEQLAGIDGAMDTTFKLDEKRTTSVKGWGETYLNSLAAILTRQRVLNGELSEQSKKVAEITDQNKRLTQKDLESKAGQLEAIKRINEAMQASDLTQYSGTGIEAIDKALNARRKVIEQFKTIDQAENIKSLTPFLNSELEEVKKYAEKRRRFLNVDYKGGGNKNNDSFSEYLKEKKKQYEEYNAVVQQLGEEQANTNYSTLIKEGKDYREFLENKLEETKEFSKQRDIALAAQSSGFVLNPSAPIPEQIAPLVETSVDTSSINYYNSQLSRLREERRAARTQEQREEIELEIEKWERKLQIAEGGIQDEENIYSNLRRGLEDLNNNQLKEYIKYWKDRVKEAKKGSREEQEALDNIQSAENRIAENTAETLGEISGALGEASNMFRSFGDDVLADALDKISNLAMSVGSILTNIASGNWIGVVGGVIGGITSLFSGAGKNQISDYERSIQSLEKSIKRLGNEIKIAMGGEGFEKRMERMLEYQEKRATMVEKLIEYQDYYDSLANVNMGYFYYGANAQKAIDDQLAAITELDAQFKDIKNEFEEYVTGSAADSLTDSILQGLREGKKGIQDFAETFEEAMKSTLLNIFRNNYLSVEVQKFYDEFVALAGGTEIDSLTDAEINALREKYNLLIENAGSRFEVLQEILAGADLDPFGGGLDRAQGLSGAIRGITEDQAGLLEGYWNAVRIDTRGLLNNSIEMVKLANQQINHLNEIAVNTRYNRYLESIDGRMATIEKGIQEYQAQG